MFLETFSLPLSSSLLKLLSAECGQKAFLIIVQSVLKMSGYFAQVKILNVSRAFGNLRNLNRTFLHGPFMGCRLRKLLNQCLGQEENKKFDEVPLLQRPAIFNTFKTRLNLKKLCHAGNLSKSKQRELPSNRVKHKNNFSKH